MRKGIYPDIKTKDEREKEVKGKGVGVGVRIQVFPAIFRESDIARYYFKFIKRFRVYTPIVGYSLSLLSSKFRQLVLFGGNTAGLEHADSVLKDRFPF